MAEKGRKHKYGAIPAEEDGHKFPSQAEWRRYKELKLLKKGGVIRDLELQPRYPLRVNGILVTTYVADFRYWDNEKEEQVVEDVKGVVTDVYRLKKKLMCAVHGIDVVEVRA